MVPITQQEALLAQGSSLARHGIIGAALVAAVPARGSVWTQPPPTDVSPFLINDPTLGLIFALPAQLAGFTGAFTTLSGSIVPNVPSPSTFVANGWAGIEPITTLLELVGANGLQRPAVRQGAFQIQNGTVLTVLSFSQDVLTPAVDQDDLYLYLTGSSGPLYRPIVADDAVHSMYVSNPIGLLAGLRNGVM